MSHGYSRRPSPGAVCCAVQIRKSGLSIQPLRQLVQRASGFHTPGDNSGHATGSNDGLKRRVIDCRSRGGVVDVVEENTSSRRAKREAFARQGAATCGKLLDAEIRRVEFPGGRSRDSLRLHLPDRSVIATRRDQGERAVLEIAVLRELKRAGADDAGRCDHPVASGRVSWLHKMGCPPRQRGGDGEPTGRLVRLGALWLPTSLGRCRLVLG